jgi:transcriptional regulator with XRE-family HTH domain
MDEDDQVATSLGVYVRQARERAGLSLRNLEQITGITRAMLSRLENDRIERPDPEVLHKLVQALELDSRDVFAFVGYEPGEDLPSLAPYLRARYSHLPPEAIAEASRRLQELLDEYDSEERHPEQTN